MGDSEKRPKIEDSLLISSNSLRKLVNKANGHILEDFRKDSPDKKFRYLDSQDYNIQINIKD